MKSVALSGIVDYFAEICLYSDCVPACVNGQCNTSLGVCECSDGYTGVDCSSIGIATCFSITISPA